ncbi:MAG TPA: hypothetical protein VM734_15190, partial [Kofleriaceae bacterium]|nr:hypothetical protein [Kofleriaceae bacterium]
LTRPAPLEPVPSATLAAARVSHAATAHTLAVRAWRAGLASVDAACAWSARWLRAQHDQTLDAVAWTHALADHASRMRTLETEAARRHASGTATTADVEAAADYRAEAELWVACGKVR